MQGPLEARQVRVLIRGERRIFSGLLQKRAFSSHHTLGAELEVPVANLATMTPAPVGPEIISEAAETALQSELLRQVVEINSPTYALGVDAVTSMGSDMARTLAVVAAAAKRRDCCLIPVGIPPRARREHITPEYISQNIRYRELGRSLQRYHGDDGNRTLMIPGSTTGTAPLRIDRVPWTVEGITTSLQVHVSLRPEDLGAWLNRAHAVLWLLSAAAAFSTRIFGRSMAAASRIPVWYCSIGGGADNLTPFMDHYMAEGDPEGYLDWVETFLRSDRPCFLPLPEQESRSLGRIERYISQIWAWVRPRFGLAPAPHVRLEIRPMCTPATIPDLKALVALTSGLLLFLDKMKIPAARLLSCGDARTNWDSAVLSGLDAEGVWGRLEYDPHLRIWQWQPCRMSVHDALAQACRWAADGFMMNAADSGAAYDESEAVSLLAPVAEMARTGQNGSTWMEQSVNLLTDHPRPPASWEVDEVISRAIAVRRDGSVPVAHWDLPKMP